MTPSPDSHTEDPPISNHRHLFATGKPIGLLLAAAAFLLGVAATAGRTIKQYQTPGPFDHSRQGMCDFHNGIYFPTQAILRGTSPYSQRYADSYPVARQIPFFSPAILVIHAPLAMMPLRIAEILYFTFSVVMLFGIGWLIASALANACCDRENGDQENHVQENAFCSARLDVTLAIAAGLVFSRGGHITLFDGYFTIELVLATFLAVHWGDRRPWLAGLALVIVSAKPTYIIPLGFMLLVRGNVRAIIIGAVLSIVACLVPMLWLAHNEGGGDIGNGLQVLREQISTSQDIHRADPDETPATSWTRVDLLAVVAKWTKWDPKEAVHLIVMMVILAPVLRVLHQRRKDRIDDGLVGFTGALILTACLVSLYHQSYDVMLLAAPWAAILTRTGFWNRLSLPKRVGLAALMAAPLFNYASTRMAMRAIEPTPFVVQVLTSLNGIVLTILLVWLLVLAQRSSARAHLSENL